jgi:ABC-type nitrate/sulfonate/bicarbonate transport system substrate-binding protein
VSTSCPGSCTSRNRLLAPVLALLWLSACGGAAPVATGTPASAQAKPEREQVTALYGTTSGSSAAMWLAGEKGFFQRHGLTVDVRYAESNATTAALLAGEAQFAQGDGGSALGAYVSGVPMKIIAVLNKRNSYAIVARPEIKSPEDLRGKSLAIARPGDTSDISAHMALRPYGLSPGTDLTSRSVGNSAPRLAALLSGSVAAAVLSEAFVDQAVSQGMHVLVNLEKAQIPYMATAVEIIDSFGKANLHTTMAYLKGLIEGERFFADESNKAEVLPILARYFKTKPDDPSVEDNYRFYHQRLVHDIYPDKDGADTTLEALRAIDSSRYASVSSEAIIDGSYMARIRDSGFQKQVWSQVDSSAEPRRP